MKIKIFGHPPRRRIYLVAPKNPDAFWSMQATVDAVGARALMPNAALATLVALTPAEAGVEYVYCDENLAPVQLDLPCDLVALTGYTLHAPRLRQLSAHFRSRGIPVALGGAFATLDPDAARPLADHFFRGEAELTWPRFLRDLPQGRALAAYEQREPVSMADSPPPDWSLVRGRDYVYFTVQASRGCPNRCAFCDAVRLVGRRHRAKEIDQVLQEIDNARLAGATTVFFSEDNFFANRAYTQQLLQRIVEYNCRLARPLSFSCQASVAIADDDDLLRLLADARMSVIFLGVESVRQTCLEEIDKGHLFRPNLAERIRAISRHGILPFTGLIVGFDHDDAQTFPEIEQFLASTSTPLASISVLNAPEHTVLHERLKQAGRISEGFKGFWHASTNIVPSSMSLDVLLIRHRALFSALYEPARFEERAVGWLRGVRYHSPLYRKKKLTLQKLASALPVFRHYLLAAPPPVRALFFRLLRRAWHIDPRLVRKAITIMTQYCHYYSFVHDPAWQEAVR
ncbi:MAG: radical SAM protein [Deltaproteobacteria bacterium]|nr:radical SAM protein [Deltaproteobacteria bacterium]